LALFAWWLTLNLNRYIHSLWRTNVSLAWAMWMGSQGMAMLRKKYLFCRTINKLACHSWEPCT
jgi:hypothetical protein